MLKKKTNTSKPNSDGTDNSWEDKVRVTDSSTRFTLEPLSRQPLGCNLKYAANSIASRAWCSYGLKNITTTANGFMIFRFKTEDELHTVLEKGPWMLYGLPFPLWSKQGLSLAVSMAGRPLSCDELTYNCTRLEYARLCVEVDATLPFVHSFEIESPLSVEPLIVTVDYEWKPSRCEQCNVFGHCCPTPTEDKGKGKTHVDSPASPTQLQPEPQLTSSTPLANTHIAPHPPADKPFNITPPIQPSYEPHTNSQPDPIIVPADPKDDDDDCSSQDSGNELLDLQHHHLNTMPTICLESKMDSLRTASASSSTAQEVLAKASSSSIPHNPVQSSSPSPTTIRKKKGGRKKKEAKGH
ncbi:hypothetical protein NC653_026708 [Populus alba x Populus x berolinensis]|uniref:DUF4283 domain-containing protein n=1 Tax=Populus alba x Populus x berolinensis TaxID=444605 RepID=A0AAD6M3Q3_9ROSI|nr:hypothetical protein NC653_026708 [Populus alba x Populus x berolinensis]